MPKILIAECKQEVSTFNPHLSGYDDFAMRRGEEMLALPSHGAQRSRRRVERVRCDAPAWRWCPAYSALLHHLRRHARGGGLAAHRGRVSREHPRRAAGRRRLLLHARRDGQRSRSSIPKATCSPRRARFSARQIPIVVSLDLHGILTDRMLEHSDAIVAYHTYPHVDFFETGQRAARLLLRIVAGEVKPVTAKRGHSGAGARRRIDHRDRPVRPEHARSRRRSSEGPAGLSAGHVHRQSLHRCAGAADLQLRRHRRRSRAGRARGDPHRRRLLGAITRRCRCRS